MLLARELLEYTVCALDKGWAEVASLGGDFVFDFMCCGRAAHSYTGGSTIRNHVPQNRPDVTHVGSRFIPYSWPSSFEYLLSNHVKPICRKQLCPGRISGDFSVLWNVAQLYGQWSAAVSILPVHGKHSAHHFGDVYAAEASELRIKASILPMHGQNSYHPLGAVYAAGQWAANHSKRTICAWKAAKTSIFNMCTRRNMPPFL